MNTTVRIKASEIYKDWHVIDAAGRPLGRVATEAAILLRGKHKPTYEPHLDDGDFVIIINAAQVRVTGRKSEQIKYRTHSGYPGGLKTRTYEQQMAKFPERVLEKAVWGMLPGGSLGEAIFRHLKVYKTAQHPHQSQITGSERAREAREAAVAEAGALPLKAKRLRPLGVPDSIAQAREAGAAPDAAPSARSAASRARARVGRAPKDASDSTTAVELEAQDEAVLTSHSPPVENPVTPTPVDAAVAAAAAPEMDPAPSSESDAAPSETEATPKPRAKRKATSTDDDSETTAPEASTDDAAEPKKPARRRTAKTEE